jgi:predicted transcriptional regulator
MKRRKILSEEQITEGKELRQQGYTKAKLADMFGVGKTTVWENIFSTTPRMRIQHKRIYRKHICIPCVKCEICMTQIIKQNEVPVNLQIGDICLKCYLRKNNIKFTDIL